LLLAVRFDFLYNIDTVVHGTKYVTLERLSVN